MLSLANISCARAVSSHTPEEEASCSREANMDLRGKKGDSLREALVIWEPILGVILGSLQEAL